MSRSPRPLRFGAVVSVRGAAREWADEARRLEASGYSTLLVPDTLWTPSPFPVLAAAAGGTTTLRLGTWVLSAPLRRPAEVVRETRTLQTLSVGRFELGIGAGRPGGEKDAEALGVAWGSPRERVDRVEETIDAVAGQVEPVPRIVIAGRGDRMLRLAGRAAGTLALPTAPEIGAAELADVVRHVRELGGDDLELAMQVTGVGDELPGWLRHRLGLTPDGLRASGAVMMLTGDLDRDADTVQRLRDEAGVSYLTVPGELASRLSPLVERLAGT
ncbi:LLM class flavin-dependent oxidoreductase [Microbacterium sp. 4R-513]|uniref:LLM class flavin-dependent oxidoreductase n=1 Tax=Microbacterium sp. 4R-513 TaxID=2567934 RepID=UPI0013E12F8E|nr:LLM class flavin-dependent oxidoreductase [Microbacterium sp. 4R-513]QIG39076.1 LLM class flavin-dependent oxidoreductase [Microbacterium sp. 4R-513]